MEKKRGKEELHSLSCTLSYSALGIARRDSMAWKMVHVSPMHHKNILFEKKKTLLFCVELSPLFFRFFRDPRILPSGGGVVSFHICVLLFLSPSEGLVYTHARDLTVGCLTRRTYTWVCPIYKYIMFIWGTISIECVRGECIHKVYNILHIYMVYSI